MQISQPPYDESFICEIGMRTLPLDLQATIAALLLRASLQVTLAADGAPAAAHLAAPIYCRDSMIGF